MIALAALALTLAAAPRPDSPARSSSPAEQPPQQRTVLAQVIVRERVIVRVPTRAAPPPAVKWKTKKGPKCIAADALAGAAVHDSDSIDLISRGGERMRADLESACPAIDYYSGFYLMPSADRQVCAGRDSVHARSGGACQIRRFRKLVPDD